LIKRKRQANYTSSASGRLGREAAEKRALKGRKARGILGKKKKQKQGVLHPAFRI